MREVLLRELADGRFHSGQQLALALGVSRVAVWKQIRRLASDLGLAVDAVRGRGYRLGAPLELLDHERIRAEFSAATCASLDALCIEASTDSTNRLAASDLPDESGRARVWLAEHQTAGRGRRGRVWVSPFGSNLYLSVAWRFDLPMSQLAGLSLAAGAAVAEALQRLGIDRHCLKWPNDILIDGRKLAGILVEVSGETGGPATAVVGVGVNLRLSAADAQAIDQPWIDLERAIGGAVSRNRLAGVVVDQLVGACSAFAERQLEPFLARWEAFDTLRGEPVSVMRGDLLIEGTYCGISASGGMILETSAGRSEHHAGEVSLRTRGGR